MSDREPGLYWVRIQGEEPEWEIAKKNISGRWNILGSEENWNDDDFDEIGERVDRNQT